LEEFLTLAVRERLYGNRGNLHFFMRSIFRGSLLEGARVLDVGGGTGLCSYYAAAVGATKAVCLEPEADGGTRTAHEGFKRLAYLAEEEVHRVVDRGCNPYNFDNLLTIAGYIRIQQETGCQPKAVRAARGSIVCGGVQS
jgi:hypothetical protein